MKAYFTMVVLAAGCFGVSAQTAYNNATFSKENVVTHQYDASSLVKIEVTDQGLRGVKSNGDEVFSIESDKIDALHFNKSIAIGSLDMRTETNPNYPGYLHAQMQLTKGTKLSLEGIDIACVPTHFFNVTDGKAVYNGADGTFDLWYNDSHKALYLENRALTYPDVAWISGGNWCHQNNTTVLDPNISWIFGEEWSAPEAGLMAYRSADGVYEASLYLAKGAQVKFYQKRDTSAPFGSLEYLAGGKLDINYIPDPNTGYGYFPGDFTLGSDIDAGIYTICMDTNRKVVYIKDGLFDPETIAAQRAYKINGKELREKTFTTSHDGYNFSNTYLVFPPDYEGGNDDAPQLMTQGQEVSFEGFSGDLSKMLHPDYFEVREGKAYFTAPTGYYQMKFKKDRNILYVTSQSNENHKVWITGVGIGHPCQSVVACDASGEMWGDDPVNYFTAIEKNEGELEATLFIESGCKWTALGPFFRFYPWQCPDLNQSILNANSGITIVNEVGESQGFRALAGSERYGFANDWNHQNPEFTPGVYKVKISGITYNDNNTVASATTVTFTKVYPKIN